MGAFPILNSCRYLCVGLLTECNGKKLCDCQAQWLFGSNVKFLPCTTVIPTVSIGLGKPFARYKHSRVFNITSFYG